MSYLKGGNVNMDEKQYINDKEGLILNLDHTYIYIENQRFEITLKDIFSGMVCEINKSIDHLSLNKRDYKIKLSLKIIPKKKRK